ncbi:MAG TPA: hypothetical protein VNA04_15900 [Thermoanaerobaculia bacterium]|nr:hypothetical protein [Thermoanaerobaculia bacterium]
MRKFILVLGIVALVAAALGGYLVATTPRSSAGVRFPLSPAQRELLAAVPADADAFALIPTAAAAHARLRRNPLAREAVETWTRERPLPPRWMLGGADLLSWRSSGGVAYAFRLDPLRALLLRGYVFLTGSSMHAEGTNFVIGAPPSGLPLGDAELEPLLRLAAGMDGGDAVLVQRRDAQMFPPIARPALSTVSVHPREIVIVSRARNDSPAGSGHRTVTLPRGALLSSWFGDPPRLVADLDRLLPGDVTALLSDGGSIVLYDVESRRLLPRLRGLFVIADSPEARASARRLSTVAEMFGEVAYRDGRILISLDRTSLGVYGAEQFSELPFPATEWAVRIDAGRMVPVLEGLGESIGLRLTAPRLYRSVRDLRAWIGHMRGAGVIEAALAREGEGEELRVRITAK